MKIRITKGSGWYENEIGTEFDVIRSQKNRSSKTEYIVWENDDTSYNWVDEDDCEVVTE